MGSEQVAGQAKTEPTRTIVARWVVPVDRPPIAGGWIRMSGGRIVDIGAGPAGGPATDLGDVALLPRPVNAHTHLEFSDLSRPIGEPGIGLHDWIGQVIAARAAGRDPGGAPPLPSATPPESPGNTMSPAHTMSPTGRDAPANGEPPIKSGPLATGESAAVRRGLLESQAAGVGLVADIATPGPAGPADHPPGTGPDVAAHDTAAHDTAAHDVDSPGSADPTHDRGDSPRGDRDDAPVRIPFAEVIGLSPERWRERLAAAEAFLRRFPRGGWSPHAPYSTDREAIRRCVDRAIAGRRPLAMHVAESPAERELLERGEGPFADSLRRLGVWRDGTFPWPENPMPWLLAELARAPRLLLIHGNDLREDEIRSLAGRSHITVVYCPRTHARFGYQPHPVRRLIERGVRVALGTDSRASNPDLNLWREAQWLWRHRQDLSPTSVLAMATAAGADALGMPGWGRLRAGSPSRIAAVPTAARSPEQLWSDLAEHSPRPWPVTGDGIARK